MKKIALVLVLVVLVSGLYAEEAGRKIGFGLGIYDGGEITRPNYLGMKWVLTPTITLEPTIYFDKTSFDEKMDSVKTDEMEIGVGVNVLFPFMSGGNTDVFGFGGLLFDMFTYKTEDYHGKGYEYKTTGTMIEIPFGIGLEHFITKTFSVDLRANSWFSIMNSKTEYTYDSTTDVISEDSGMSISLNNIMFTAALYWYCL